MNNLSEELATAKQTISNVNEENIRLQFELQNVNQHANTLNEQIATLKQSVSELNNNQNNNTVNMDYDRTQNVDDENSVANLNTLLKRELHLLTSDVEARIKLECDKMKKDLMDLIAGNVNTQSAKRKKGNTNRYIPSTTGMENTPTSSRAPNYDLSHNTDDLLIPPDEVNVPENKDVYEIHVSKFSYKQNEENIAKHIIKKTGVNHDHFKVIKLISKKPWKQSNTCSFKIITIDANTYRIISDKAVWGDYEVRDFETSQNNKQRGQYGNRNNYTNRNGFTKGNGNTYDLRRAVIERNVLNGPSFDRGQGTRNKNYIDSPITININNKSIDLYRSKRIKLVEIDNLFNETGHLNRTNRDT